MRADMFFYPNKVRTDCITQQKQVDVLLRPSLGVEVLSSKVFSIVVIV